VLKDIRYVCSVPARYEDGRAEELTVLVEIIDAGTLNDPHAEIQGLKRICTAAGDPVNRLEKGRYETLAGEILTSDAPNAP
jgi:hypothetical protein